MNLHASYFHVPTLSDLYAYLDRKLHPYRHFYIINLRDSRTLIRWTKRANQALEKRHDPLVAEMQLYFSCFVKKRVVFSDQCISPVIRVNDRLCVGFSTVESLSCDPVEFAQNFPVKKKMSTPGAKKMHPSLLELDYRNGKWIGWFRI